MLHTRKSILHSKSSFKFSIKIKQEIDPAILCFISIISFLASFFLNAALAKILSTEAYGNFSTAIYFFETVCIIIAMGCCSSTSEFYANYDREKNYSYLTRYSTWLINILKRNSKIIIVTIGLCLILLFTYHSTLGNYTSSATKYYLFLLFMLISPIGTYADFQSDLLTASEKPIISNILFTNFIPLLILASVFFILKENIEHFNPLWLVLIYFSCYLIASIILKKNNTLRRNSIRKLSADYKEKNKKDLIAVQSSWLDLAKKSFVASIYINLADYLSLIILNIMAHINHNITTSHQVAIYSCVLSITGIFYSIPCIFFSGLVSNISYAIKNKSESDQNKKAKTMFFLLIPILSIITIILLCFGKNILLFFGPEYVHGYHLLTILIIDGWSFNLFYYCYTALTLSGNMKEYTKESKYLFYSFIVISIVLTYFFAMYGMAIATVITWLNFGIRCFFILKNKTNLKGLGVI